MQNDQVSLIRLHAADALCRARKLPVGPSRNDLRQLSLGLRWLERKGFAAKVAHRLETLPIPVLTPTRTTP
jgi:hypothetical protein